MDPKREAALTQPDDLHLVCSRCALRFPIKDGFPVLVVEEAELPQGCPSLDRLPCQHSEEKRTTEAQRTRRKNHRE
jgi:uncharacterized protein